MGKTIARDIQCCKCGHCGCLKPEPTTKEVLKWVKGMALVDAVPMPKLEILDDFRLEYDKDKKCKQCKVKVEELINKKGESEGYRCPKCRRMATWITSVAPFRSWSKE